VNEIKIDNWAVVGRDPYLAPELQTNHLIGTVTNHPAHEDGREVKTSRIVGMEEPDIVITVSGSRYVLGEIDPEYEAEYPNARERLFDSLRRMR